MDPIYSGPKMEARSTSGGGQLSPAIERLVEDPFFYGHRWVEVEDERGKRREQVPLTREDLLDPQEGDYVSNHSWHGEITAMLATILRALFTSRGRQDIRVGDDLKMLWKDKTISRVAPDICVIPNVQDTQRGIPSFNEGKEGTKPIFVLEVTSDATEETDKGDKIRVYQKAEVSEYVILDREEWEKGKEGTGKEDKKLTLTGYRLHPETKRYRKIRPGKEGLFLETLDLHLSVGDDGRRLVLIDALTGERLRDLTEVTAAASEAEAKLREAEAEIERLKALLKT